MKAYNYSLGYLKVYIYKIINKIHIPLVVSGGISNLKNVKKLYEAKIFEGVIIGRAIYDKSISLDKLNKFI